MTDPKPVQGLIREAVIDPVARTFTIFWTESHEEDYNPEDLHESFFPLLYKSTPEARVGDDDFNTVTVDLVVDGRIEIKKAV